MKPHIKASMIDMLLVNMKSRPISYQEEHIRRELDLPDNCRIDLQNREARIPIEDYIALLQELEKWEEARNNIYDQEAFVNLATNIYRNIRVCLALAGAICFFIFIPNLILAGANSTITIILFVISVICLIIAGLMPDQSVMYNIFKILGRKKHNML